MQIKNPQIMKNCILISFILLITGSVASAQWQDVYHFNTQLSYGIVHANGGDSVIVAGNDGLIHFSSDGGQSFSADSLPFPFGWFLDIDFPSHKVGYICGGSAFGPVKSFIGKTTDGGLTWDSIAGNQFGYQLNAVSFINEDRGYFAGSNLLVKTNDGGQTFVVDTLEPFAAVTAMSFLNDSTGFYMYHRSIFKTVDAGQNWNIVFTDTNPNIFPVGGRKLDFVDAQSGLALTQAGEIITTTDGGNTWNYSVIPPDTLGVVDFDFVSVSTGYAISLKPTTGGQISFIHKTVDGGQSWMLQYIDSLQILRSISAASADVAYAIGDSILLATSNGGIGDEEFSLQEGIVLLPNPASAYFNVSRPAGLEINKLQVLDISGRLIREYADFLPGKNFSVEGLQPNIYLVRLSTSQGIRQEKLMVTY